MFLGRECALFAAAALLVGVGGGKLVWMNVFCTMKPMLPSVDGVSGLWSCHIATEDKGAAT
eukprot:CAMPEP_0183479356 /NCGR_PEP_ID=MMETSP0370-20130417/171469_1 /TAXON_ID=268820 /ORGANISM="Peridinium aciculiferum, Strain PAER-2" /LENGTH=60 /DNA_ID=CAMNT_0025672371 /DNA_START=148 /DNA_END=327 /DNA_ORIENTATION=+